MTKPFRPGYWLFVPRPCGVWTHAVPWVGTTAATV